MDRVPVIAFISDAILPYHHGGKELRIHQMTHRIAACAEVHYLYGLWRYRHLSPETGAARVLTAVGYRG